MNPAAPGPRLGLAVGLALSGADDAAGWRARLEWVELAEALGLHSVWVPEGHFVPGASASPLVALAAFAARTRRLRLATTSLLLPIHPPLRLAAEVGVLDTLSGGRVMLGLGRGFRTPVFEGFGVSPASKRDRFDAALDAILGAWAAGNASPRPVQLPHPPLVVAAFGKRGLIQAARRGLPYLASPLETLDTLEENHTIHREHLPDGWSPPKIAVPVMRTVFVADDDGEAGRVLEGLRREFSSRQGVGRGALARAASGRLEDRVLVGTAAAVTEGILRYRERLGMDLLVARVQIPGVSSEALQASLERLVGDVLPGLGTVPSLEAS